MHKFLKGETFLSPVKIFWVLIGLVWFFPNILFAQLEQPNRLEIELAPTDHEFYVASAVEKGVVMFRETPVKEKSGDYLWEFIKLDTLLKQQWSNRIAIDHHFYLTAYDYSDDNLYLLYQRKTNNNDYHLIRMNIHSGDTLLYSIRQFLPLNLTDFTISGNNILFVGKMNFKSAVVQYDMNTRRIKVLPGYYNNNSEVLELKVNHDFKAFHILSNELAYDRKNFLSLRIFDNNGGLIRNTVIKPDRNLNFVEGRATILSTGEQVVVGTYSLKFSGYSQGVFMAKVKPNGAQQVHYYSYGELENFFGYMSPKKEDRIKRKILRKREGGRAMNYYYRMNISKVLDKEGHVVMLAEAYYPYHFIDHAPTLTYEGSYYRSFGHGPYQQGTPGFKYTHAIVVCFDDNGKLYWDNSLEINDLVSVDLKKNVSVGLVGNKVALLYLRDNTIQTKVIQNGEVLVEKTENEVKLNDEENEEALKSSGNYDEGGVEWWYGHTYFAYGVQEIKSVAEKSFKNQRVVFYVNKLQYR